MTTPASAQAALIGKEPMFGRWGVDLTAIDGAVRPGDDFFLYANGAWIARTEIPPDKASTGLFQDLDDRARAQIREVIQSGSSADAATSADQAKINDLYHAYMDEAAIEAAGAAPIAGELQRVAQAASKSDIARLMCAAHGGLGGSFFALSVVLDDKDPRRYALAARQAGLSLGSRDYYLEPSFFVKKAKFRDYVAQVLELAGWPEPQRRADAILALESAIAEASWSIAESQQLDKTYHSKTTADLAEFAPGFDWRAWPEPALRTRVG